LETNVVSIDSCTQEVTFTLTSEDLIPHFERAYREAQPNLEIKGFRKGKVPLPIIKQRFGRQIENDSLMNVADDEFKSYTRNNNIRVIGQPQLMDMKKESDGTVSYIIRFDTIPEFELGSYEGLELLKPIHTVSDDEVDVVVQDMLVKAAVHTSADKADDNLHTVHVRFIKVDDETGKPIEGVEAEENTIFLNHPDLDGFLRDSLIGKKVGEKVTYIDAPESDNSNPDRFDVEILKVEKLVKPELNDAFVSAYSNGRLNTVDELYQDIRKYNNTMLENETRKELEVQVVEQMSTQHTFLVPKAIVQDVMVGMLENLKKQQKDNPEIQNMNISEMEDVFRPYAEQTARWELVRDKIIEKEGIQLEENDIIPYMEYYRQNSKLNDDQILSFLMKENNLMGSIVARKAMDKILEKAIITDTDPETYFKQKELHAGMFGGLDDIEAEISNDADIKPTKKSSKTAKSSKKDESADDEKPKRKSKAKTLGE
jgi:trigger factor